MNVVFSHRLRRRLPTLVAVLLGGVLMFAMVLFVPLSAFSAHAATPADVSDTSDTSEAVDAAQGSGAAVSDPERTQFQEMLVGGIGIAVAVLLAALAWAVRVRGWKKKDGSPTGSAA